MSALFYVLLSVLTIGVLAAVIFLVAIYGLLSGQRKDLEALSKLEAKSREEKYRDDSLNAKTPPQYRNPAYRDSYDFPSYPAEPAFMSAPVQRGPSAFDNPIFAAYVTKRSVTPPAAPQPGPVVSAEPESFDSVYQEELQAVMQEMMQNRRNQ